MSRHGSKITGAGAALTLATALAAPLAPAAAATPAPDTRTSATAHTALPAHTARPASADILQRLRRIKGLTVTEVTKGVPQGFRYFTATIAQPVDHDDPSKGTFQQRLTLLHRDVNRPTVFFTSGYNVSLTPGRSEPTRIVDGNQVSMEYRFFDPSRPKTADWKSQLTIRQGAADQHAIYLALKAVYPKNWLATGGSKGGMTATYYRYFFPQDMSGTIPYVAPNDVDNTRDAAYDRLLRRVGTATCRNDLIQVQRRLLGTDRAWFANRIATQAAAAKETFTIVGTADKALEVGVNDTYFAFWQYQPATACGRVPDAATATREELWAWLNVVNPLTAYTDQQVSKYIPYYYQAAAQLGWPTPYETPMRDLLKYPGINQPLTFLPDDLKPIAFDRTAMRAVDAWVRTSASQMLFVNGTFDPWSAEPFSCGSAAAARVRDCLRFDVVGGNHGSTIQQLPEPTRSRARAKIQAWAGLTSFDKAATSTNRQGATANTRLDRPMIEQHPAMR